MLDPLSVDETFSSELLARAGDAATMVPIRERSEADRVLEICHELIRRSGAAEGILPVDERSLRIELGRLAEVLGRRSTAALAFAALARAALAQLAGDSAAVRATIAEADRHLSMRGL